MDVYSALIYLAKCAVKNEKPSSQAIVSMDLEQVAIYARRHMISCIIAYALKMAGISEPNLQKTLLSTISKQMQFNYELGKIIQLFEKQGIWYMPLKGFVIKELYPYEYMREMSDCDLLIDASRRMDARKIMECMGYRTEYYNVSNEDVYLKLPFYNFEFHAELFKDFDDIKIYKYYKDIRSKLIKDNGNEHGYHLSNEDLYIYLIAHEYMHYYGSGTGFRSLIDTYLFIKKKTIDMNYVEHETKKMGINAFEEKNRMLALHVFEDVRLTEDEEKMLQYILDSGVYGKLENKIKNIVANNKSALKGKMLYIIQRIAIPYSKNNPMYKLFERQYPFFYKHKILLPILPLYRLYRARKKTPGRIMDEIKMINKT